MIAGQGDLWYPIDLLDSDANREHFFRIGTASCCEHTKKQWEHHPSPFSYQLFSIARQSAVIRGLITPFTEHLTEPSEPAFSLAKLVPHSAGMEGCQGSWQTGLYNDPVTQQVYYLKQTSCELSAQNQLLMARLARLLGITVPESFIHQEQGCFYVVSHVPVKWQGKLKGGEEALRSLSSEQWARLLLVNVIVGNENMVNSAWEGIELTPEGEPVMFHWDCAGLATRYPCSDKPEPAPEADDFSSMPVLLKKLRDPLAPPMNSFPIDNPCIDILAQLDDDFLGHTLKKILRQVDWQALNRLIEHSGFLPGDRSWLRQTVHDRIAWLTTRLPNSLEAGERVSMAEYKAIEAAGIRGGWLPVKGRDIQGDQICVNQLLDADGQPITRMSLKLSREAGNQLADNLALERGLHHLARRVKYTNMTLNTLNDDYRDWRGDLTTLASQCNGMAAQLTRDKERWHKGDHPVIDLTVMTLQDIVKKCRTSLATDLPSIEELPTINPTLPAPGFPARVSSRLGEEVEAKVHLAEFSHGFARLTGQSVNYLNPQHLKASYLADSPIQGVELETATVKTGSILFFPPKLPYALTFEHQLIITLPGHSKAVVEALFNELSGLGIEGGRPNAGDLEEQWLDALADYHGCLGDMNLAVAADINTPVNTSKKKFLKTLLNLSDDDPFDWEVHCRIRTGRLVHYLPGLPHNIRTNPAQRFCPGHNINFIPDQDRDSTQVLINSLKNEAALSSFERRSQMGVEPSGNIVGMEYRMNYDTQCVFSRLMVNNQMECEREYAGPIAMVFKPEALGRLDGSIFPDLEHLFELCPEVDAHTRNQKIIAQSAQDYHRVIEGNEKQEIRFLNPLSLLDELDKFKISSPKDQQLLLHTLSKRYSHWPNGRPLEQLFPHSWSFRFYELTDEYSKVDKNIKKLVSLCGEKNIQFLFEKNPQLFEGKLNSLDGLKLKGLQYRIKGFDLSDCSMNGTVLERVSFKNCKLNVELLCNATIDNVFFTYCSFEGQRFPSSVLDTIRFCPENDLDGTIFDSTRRLSRIIYQSCINQQNEFNLAQWLRVMEKSHYLRYSKTPLDDLTRDILSKNIEEIIRTYPHLLCKIVNGLFGIRLTNIGNAISFVRNNPEFYDHKIKDFRDLYLDFRTIFLQEGRYPGQQGNPFERLFNLSYRVHKDFPREAVVALILNVMNLVMFPQPDNHYIDFGVNSNNEDKHDDCGKTDSDTKDNSTACPESDELALNNMKTYRAYFYREFLKELRDYVHKFWGECSEEGKLTIARHCLSHHNVAVSHLTTVEFMKFLAENDTEKNWLDDFTANMEKHKNNQHQCNLLLKEHFGPKACDRTVIDASLPISTLTEVR
ncbi:hypothetical protein [Endozoicomonas sp. SCSIO W0465]|uniref:hypothetical protein n=1 Tax=Endozoicomonas sp. SCSIO W0465 TaxID=2918516 RepID=UPI0020758809|nr:hypothetical protein [Endozoicomonas sp. SCSIO W0465]USE34237.1 hypothetical protein MJO57_18990 [Endozoicomonas sp. SCSIO W0465]